MCIWHLVSAFSGQKAERIQRGQTWQYEIWLVCGDGSLDLVGF